MNSRWNSRATRATIAALLGLAGAACVRDKPAASSPPAAASTSSRADLAQQEAATLGRDVFYLVDRIAAYAASNERKNPRSLRLAGIDSLTPDLARRIDTRMSPPLGVSMFRKPLGHALTSCRGTTDLLEESALNDGHFTVTCTDSLGQSSSYKVQRASGR